MDTQPTPRWREIGWRDLHRSQRLGSKVRRPRMSEIPDDG